LNPEQFMNQSFEWVAYGTLALAVPVFVILLFIRAPYGRHIRRGWGPLLDNRLGWFIMESPAVLVFFSGMALNKVSDRQLARLSRIKGDKGDCQIPHGLAYRWVSCPNYLGEITQWTGWAIATWSLAGWVFAIWTMANLAPRALAHHRWYRETFKDYPARRRALIPFLL
jgi:protein-S-isoprenylcysteine O-methyltransferase Ste14